MTVDFVLFSTQKKHQGLPWGGTVTVRWCSFPHDHVASIQTVSPKRAHPLENLKVFTVWMHTFVVSDVSGFTVLWRRVPSHTPPSQSSDTVCSSRCSCSSVTCTLCEVINDIAETPICLESVTASMSLHNCLLYRYIHLLYFTPRHYCVFFNFFIKSICQLGQFQMNFPPIFDTLWH